MLAGLVEQVNQTRHDHDDYEAHRNETEHETNRGHLYPFLSSSSERATRRFRHTRGAARYSQPLRTSCRTRFRTFPSDRPVSFANSPTVGAYPYSSTNSANARNTASCTGEGSMLEPT